MDDDWVVERFLVDFDKRFGHFLIDVRILNKLTASELKVTNLHLLRLFGCGFLERVENRVH